jgi:phage shock protein PspC (stress-responsive transcriptional regulator)
MSVLAAEPLGEATTDVEALDPVPTAWVAGGVVAELADRLAASAGFIRVLLVLAAFFRPQLLYVYLFAVLVVPHGERRTPSWSNLIGLGRCGLLLGLIYDLSAGGGLNGIFGAGTAAWLPLCGATLFGIVAVLASGVAMARRDSGRDRSLGLAILAVAAGVGLVALAVVLLPAVRWDWALGALAAVGGVALALGGRRARPLLIPVSLVAVVAVLFASTGVRLQGGIGDARFAPVNESALRHSYRRGVGELTLDLDGLRPSRTPVTITASVGIGTLRLLVPGDADVTATLGVGRGTFEALTCVTSHSPLDRGFLPTYVVDETRTISSRARQPGCGYPIRRPRLRLRIHASVGIGTLELALPSWNTSPT